MLAFSDFRELRELTARVLGYACSRKPRESEHIQSVIGGNHDDILVLSEEFAIICRLVGAARVEASTVYPEKHCLAGLASLWLGPNVQIQAIFALLVADLGELRE